MPTSDDDNAASSSAGRTSDLRETMQQKHEDRNKSTLVGLSDDDPPSSPHRSNHNSRVLDHYSLPTPSSTVRFRSAHVHVYDSQGSQLIMEERLTTKNNVTLGKSDSLSLHGNGEKTNTTSNVTVKRVMNASPELLFLRGLYSAIAFFKAAFLFIFSVGLLLFLIVDIAEQARVIIYDDMGDRSGKLNQDVSSFVNKLLSDLKSTIDHIIY